MSLGKKIGLGLCVAIIAVFALGFLMLKPGSNPGRTIVELKGIGAPFELIDNQGNTITQTAMKGHPTAVFFGFTFCPEVCPTTLADLGEMIDELGDEGKDLRAFFITVDPERDTPEVMNDYVTAMSDRIVGITGDKAKLEALAKSWYVYSKRVPLEDGDYTLDHTASIYLVDRRGNLKSTITYDEDPTVARQKLRALLAG